MDASNVSALTETLVNVLLGCASLAVLSWVLVGIESFIADRKHEKREKEYHAKRMKDLDR